MPNPFKSLKRMFGKKSGGKTEEVDPTSYPELYVIWPDGTWNKENSTHKAEMDNNVRGAILDTWARENFIKAEQLAGFELNPGMFGTYPPPIPNGWLPSEKIIKLVFAKKNWDVNIMHYMVGQLKHLKHLRA